MDVNENATRYRVKFIDDDEELEGVVPDDIRPLEKKVTTFQWLSHVDKLVGKVFFDSGSLATSEEGFFEKGEFNILERVTGTNNYKCKRVFPTSEGVEGEIVEFDMFHLLKRVREYAEE